MNIYEYLKEKFNSGEFIGFTQKGICKALGVQSSFERKAVKGVLDDIEKEGEIFCIDGKYETLSSAKLYKGTLRGNEKGYAFLIKDNGESGDLFIPNRSLNGANHKDVVLARLVKSDRGSSDEAEVVKIIKREITEIGGTYIKERDFGFVRADDKNYFRDIYVPKGKSLNAPSYSKVHVKITDFEDGKNPVGEVLAVLGKRFELKAEEMSLILGGGYKTSFSKEVIKEAEEISSTISDDEIFGREDFTGGKVITIDGESSRDFDDAVEVYKTNDGNYVLCVHIADVSHYVKRGSKIDKEGYNRSNSVYFPDFNIPMLPEKLCNGICSLNEGERRLTLSCIMEISQTGKIIDRRIVKGVIKSTHRMTYNNVQAILDGDKKLIEEYADIVPMLFDMRDLMNILYEKRDKNGRIDLSVKESDISINNGEIEVGLRRNTEANKIIEEFMLLANETVAEYCSYLEVPFLYRVHEKPSAEKAQSFIEFIKLLGINVKWKADNVYPSDFASVLEKCENSPIYPLVNRVMLRSMQKAKYSAENFGHFGLSSKIYCHFTSPIRRYADLVVHRIVKAILDGNIGEIVEEYSNFVYECATKTSEEERKADEIERSVDDLYKVFYMSGKVGEEYDAVISGVTSFGVFCELENSVEGIVKLEDLPRGNYTFNDKAFTLSSNKYSFKLGERVRVGVMGVDFYNRRVEFIILNKIN